MTQETPSPIPSSPILSKTPSEFTAQSLRKIYFVSGLGADERIFQWLRYDGFEPVHIQWIAPERSEPIENYAQRLTEQIDEDNPVIVGLSFGGMIAIEIAKQMKTQKIILLSSVKKTAEIPFYFKLFRALPLHRIFPFKSLLWAVYWLAYWLFSPGGKEEKQLLKTILKETDPHFLKWALHKVVVWKNHEIPENLVHIHGRGDRIFPYRFVTPTYTVQGCGHLMVMNQAEEVSNLLEALILETAADRATDLE
ncbi:MAG: alpha/beta hydrolase [Cyanobacteria bacterium J06598_3]